MDRPRTTRGLEPIDLDGKANDYRKINELRRGGYVESRFSQTDPKHTKQYEDLLSTLRFYEADFHAVSVEGLHFIFMKPEMAELLGADVTRVRDGISETINSDQSPDTPRAPEV